MFGRERFCGFDFKYHRFVYDQVCEIFSYQLTVVVNMNGQFISNTQAAFHQFNRQCFNVHLLKKSIPQSRIDSIESTKDFLGDIRMLVDGCAVQRLFVHCSSGQSINVISVFLRPDFLLTLLGHR